jgi:hypothetical protein
MQLNCLIGDTKVIRARYSCGFAQSDQLNLRQI